MGEFEKSVKEVQEHLDASRTSFLEGQNRFRDAKQSYENADLARKEMLQVNLEEKGLAVCTIVHSGWEDKERPSLKQLGVYPKDKMRLFFQTLIGTSFVSLLCPEHFPENPNWIQGPEDNRHIMSEILQQDGKFILALNQRDITELAEKGGRLIQFNGSRNPNLGIYKYFDIPDLPERPMSGAVTYGG